MKTIYNIFTFSAVTAAAAMLAVSCYKEDPIITAKDEPQYVIEDSSDPAQHYLYTFLQDTGVYILSEYNDVDYKWNVYDESNYELTRIDPGIFNEAVEYLRKTLTDVYETGFAAKYFPFKILLAGTIEDTMSYTDDGADMVCGFGRNYIAIGQLRADILPAKDNARILADLGRINGILWGNFIYTNDLISIPESFFSPSRQYYEQNLKSLIVDGDTEAAIRSVGMWFYGEEPDSYYAMAPDAAGDVAGFVEMILTHTEEEMKAEMEGYDILLVKYNALIDAVKDATGIDLQELGDRNVGKFGSLDTGNEGTEE